MQLRFFVLFLSFLNSCSFAFGQKKFEVADAKNLYLEIEDETYPGKKKIPFKEIIIKDYRFDTTKLGYVKQGNFKRIILEANSSLALSNILNGYFKNNLDPLAEMSLLVVVKTLWLQRGNLDLSRSDTLGRKAVGRASGNDKFVTRDIRSYEDRSGACYADLEVFAKAGNTYKALCKINDNFLLYPFKPNTLGDFLFSSFDSLFRKISTTDVPSVLAKKTEFIYEQIESNYIRRLDVPILKVQENQRGIFLSFADFKGNKTVYPDFTKQQSELTDEVFVRKAGKEELLTEYWGFFDGKDYYIRLGFNFFKLTRQNNTWDLYGNKFVSRVFRRTDITYPGDFTTYGMKTMMEYRPLQLNMETGEVYYMLQPAND